MYRIIIVDDEVNAINGLKLLIDTERNNISEILSSTNAIDALKVINDQRPDIIISDISMPQMTGLEMIAEIKKIENYNPMIVILSGYSTFSYAQTAMAHGVRAYLLKPVDEDELNDKLDELIGEIEAQKQVSFERNIVLESTLIKIINGEKSPKILSTFSGLLGLKEDDEVALSASELSYKANKDIDLTDEEIDADFEKLKDIFNRIFTKSSNIFTFKLSGDQILNLVAGKNLQESELHSSFKQASNEVSASLEIELPTAFSKIITNQDKIPNEIVKLLSSIPSDNSFEDSDENVLKSADFKEVNDMFLSIANNFEVLYKDELSEKLSEAIDQAVVHNVPLSHFSAMFNAFLVNITKYVSVVYDDINEMMRKSSDLFGAGFSNLEKSKNAIINFILKIHDDMNEFNNKVQNETFHNILSYVNNNFTENLTLKSLATRFYVNPIYLGRIFKKNTGTLFNEYLTNLRIDKSKLLLKKTNKKVYEIASEIGFNDPNYFIAKFLKSEGITPSQFRKKEI